jgi:hypothetical protein
MNEINKELAGMLGLCWHEWADDGECYKCTLYVGPFGVHPDRPDFTTDSGKIELLRLMQKREDWPKFAHYVGTHNGAFPLDLMTDTTGRLAQAALEWLRKEAGDE